MAPFSRDGDLLFCPHSWQSYRVLVNQALAGRLETHLSRGPTKGP